VNIQTDENRLGSFIDLPAFFHHSGPEILSSLI
jgi:hypothetical protein